MGGHAVGQHVDLDQLGRHSAYQSRFETGQEEHFAETGQKLPVVPNLKQLQLAELLGVAAVQLEELTSLVAGAGLVVLAAASLFLLLNAVVAAVIVGVGSVVVVAAAGSVVAEFDAGLDLWLVLQPRSKKTS